MFKKNIKRIGIASIIGAGAYLMYRRIINNFFNNAFKRNEKSGYVSDEMFDFIDKSNKSKHTINSKDNLSLSSTCIENHDTSNYVLLVHGIWSSSKNMYHYAYDFDKLGYNIILIDQRTSGASQGDYYSYGYFESQDIADWCNYYASIRKNIHICLFGVSMGAATVMMSTSKNLVNNVKCVVEDCGYSSMKDEFRNVLIKEYKINKPNIVLDLLEKEIDKKFGFKFEDVEPKKALNSNVLPILLIHGTKDDFVPYTMLQELYDANYGIKEKLEVEGADHSKSYKNKKYFDVVNKFIQKYI